MVKATAEPAADKSVISDVKIYTLRVRFTEPVLGSSPANPEVYKEFIAGKDREAKEELGEEVDTLPVETREQVGWSVFHADESGLFIFDYKVRGFFKEAARAVSGKTVTAVHSKIDRWLFVSPRRLHLKRDGAVLKQKDDVYERPLRAMTMQGPRVSLKRSDMVKEGTEFDCQITVLPLGQKEFNEERLRAWLDYGRYSGISEWRTGSFGRFEYELKLAE